MSTRSRPVCPRTLSFSRQQSRESSSGHTCPPPTGSLTSHARCNSKIIKDLACDVKNLLLVGARATNPQFLTHHRLTFNRRRLTFMVGHRNCQSG